MMEIVTLVSIDEFLAEAAQTDDRIEYADGEIIYNMAGASKTHEKLVFNVLFSLGLILSARTRRNSLSQ
jgi:hypothetical protein